LRDLDHQTGEPVDQNWGMVFAVDKVNDLLQTLKENNVIKEAFKFPSNFNKKENDKLDPTRIFSETSSIEVISHDDKKSGTISVNLNVDKLESGYTGHGPDKSHIGFEMNIQIPNLPRCIDKKYSGHIFI